MTEQTTPPPGPAASTDPAQGSILPSPFVDAKGEPRNAAIKAALAEFWIALKHLPAYVKLAAAMGKDERVSKGVKAILIGGGIYTVSPLDLVPGIIPVAGQLDDLYVILTAIQQAVRLTPAEIADEHLARQGVTRADIDHDLAAVRTLVKEAAKAGFSYTLDAARQTGSKLKQLAGQFTARKDTSDDDQPL